MKIASSSVQLQASHSYREQQQRRESLRAWREAGNGTRAEIALERHDERTFQATAGQLAATRTTALPVTAPPASSLAAPSRPVASAEVDTSASEGTETADPQLTVLILLIERLTGRKVQVFDAAALENNTDNSELQGIAARHDGNGREGWGLVYDYSESYQESETTRFSAEARVRSADGQEITVTIEVNMHREFASQHNISLREGDALKDPLVINFDGNAATLGTQRIRFDIDADGRLDEFAFVDSSSGLLAFDRNGDGRINDGSELFGALSGDGFAELARHDSDHNQWLDENDAVFSRLLVWSKDGGGTDILTPLLRRNVGAIYLGSATTPFDLKDQGNALLGQIRASGIYLTEDGGSGTLQQIDLVV